jgi:hypothetical protein
MSDPSSQRLHARRVVEALRAGVPSAAAVATLGTGQSELEARYRAALDDVPRLAAQDEQATGFLVRGGFGAGKSHLLTIFEHIALAEGFAVSRIVISKETPLYDPVKLLAGAAEAMRLPDELDRGIEPVARRLLRRATIRPCSPWSSGWSRRTTSTCASPPPSSSTPGVAHPTRSSPIAS